MLIGQGRGSKGTHCHLMYNYMHIEIFIGHTNDPTLSGLSEPLPFQPQRPKHYDLHTPLVSKYNSLSPVMVTFCTAILWSRW